MATYHLPHAVAISVNDWALCCITDPLQDGCFTRICSSYDEDSEFDLLNSRAGLIGIHWFGMCWSDGVRSRFKVERCVKIVIGVIGYECRSSDTSFGRLRAFTAEIQTPLS